MPPLKILVLKITHRPGLQQGHEVHPCTNAVVFVTENLHRPIRHQPIIGGDNLHRQPTRLDTLQGIGVNGLLYAGRFMRVYSLA